MSAEEVVAFALQAAESRILRQSGGDEIPGWSVLAAAAIGTLEEAGYVIVHLPEPDQGDEDGIGWCSGPLTDWGVYVPRDIPDGKVYDQNGGVTPEQARRIASWWLAAANAAEAQS
jgi:hypothetical protein